MTAVYYLKGRNKYKFWR